MEPLDLILLALSTGAVAGLHDSARQAIKDSYFGLKHLIEQKYGDVYIALIEKEPNFEPEEKKKLVRKALERTKISEDTEVLTSAEKLLSAIKENSPKELEIIGLDMKDVNAALVEIKKIIALEGTGARFSGGEYKEIHIDEIVSGEKGKAPKVRRR